MHPLPDARAGSVVTGDATGIGFATAVVLNRASLLVTIVGRRADLILDAPLFLTRSTLVVDGGQTAMAPMP